MVATHGVDLGSFGIYTFDFEHLPAARMRAAIREAEALGWRAFWFPEVGGREAVAQASFLLASTERLHIVNGIAQVGARGARALHGAATLLADAYPQRHVLGLGYGGARPGARPLAAMSAYLDELDQLDESARDRGRPPIRRILAAYGPKMLELARDRGAGAHTYHVTAEHTAQARKLLGPDVFLGVEQAVLFESDPATARAIARRHLHTYVNSRYNVAKFRRLGYSEAEIGEGGSDRLVDDLVFWGDPDSIVERLHAHTAAGADHVAVQVLGVPPGETAVPQWRLLAEALLD